MYDGQTDQPTDEQTPPKTSLKVVRLKMHSRDEKKHVKPGEEGVVGAWEEYSVGAVSS